MNIEGRYAAFGRAQADAFQRNTETVSQSDSATNPERAASAPAAIARHTARISP
jgi:hypothetical protein